MTIAAVSHTVADMNRWTGRAEPFETDRARYWYQLAEPYEQQHIGVIGFACDQGVRRNQGRVGAKAAPPLIRQAFAALPVISELQQRFESQLHSLVMLAIFIVMTTMALPRVHLSKLRSNMPIRSATLLNKAAYPSDLAVAMPLLMAVFWDCGKR